MQREAFTSRMTETLDVRRDADRVTLRVERVVDYGEADGTRFSVFLTGPVDGLLEQATYTVEARDGDTFTLFLVPVGRERDRWLYEAAFNLEGS